MKNYHALFTTLFVFLLSMPAQSDSLSINPELSAQSAVVSKLPMRGMRMETVRSKYGKPVRIYKSSGPVKADWPRITRWEYGTFSVYFERKIVLHTVVK